MTEDSIKQALCFQALKKAIGEKELTTETFQELNAKAEILSEHLTKEMERVIFLNNHVHI
ncbi:hypothetical protein FACS1894122_14070 [Alphaproteobacteria bacterium]|nr:hypothetical protein FACS1894122_14070 [Alphaproteobacteria bacterium]